MTNEEKANEISENTLGSLEYQCGVLDGAKQMASWKDEQFEQEKEDFFDKARKFLISHGRGQLCRQFEDFVKKDSLL